MKIFALFKNVRTLWGAASPILGLLNNFVLAAVPINPLLRPLASLILLVLCVGAIGLALSWLKDVPQTSDGNSKLRRTSIVHLVLGCVFLGVYFGFLGYASQHGTESQTVNYALDVVQAVLFAIPFMFWSAFLVLVIPRK